jgi:cell division protein FtsL
MQSAARPKRRRAAQKATFYKALGVMVAIAAMAMVTLSQRVLIAQDGLAITELQRKIQNEKNEQQRLEMSLLVLESPARIQRQAQGRLRMVAPEQVSYMQIPMGPRARGARPAVVSRVSPSARRGSNTTEQGLLRELIEEVSGHVQLLPLGNVGMPPS